MFSRRYFPFQIFTIAFLAAMFLPRVLPEGMFADGLTYSAMARNMAEGRGSFWSPYFSSSFWIPFQGDEYRFYGHPALAMGMQSLLFKLLGDHWFVEKLYNILVWLAAVFLFFKFWQQAGSNKQLWWLPLLVWYLMPTVLWSYPNFLLDNTMALFTIGAALIINQQFSFTPPQYSKLNFNIIPFFLAGFVLHLAFLTKGPVGLFPLAMPFIYWFVYERKQGFKDKTATLSFQKAAFSTLFLFIGCFGTLSLWALYEPARHFWQKYFEIQLVSSISENDQTEAYSVWSYFFIPQQLLLQSVSIAGAGLILFVFSKIKKQAFIFEKNNTQKAYYFLLIALSGSLPMMISHKASHYFLIPALQFLVIGFCLWIEPTVAQWIEKFTLSNTKSLIVNRFMYLLLGGVGIYCFLQIGRVGREKELIHDIKILSEKKDIPIEAKVCVCDSMMRHFYYHAYFQRYNKWELAKLSDTSAHYFIDELNICTPKELEFAQKNRQFKRQERTDLESLRVYKY